MFAFTLDSGAGELGMGEKKSPPAVSPLALALPPEAPPSQKDFASAYDVAGFCSPQFDLSRELARRESNTSG